MKEVFKRGRDRPESAGMNVRIDYRMVMVGDRVVEKGNFSRGPEW